jgi:hypothetical protein
MLSGMTGSLTVCAQALTLKFIGLAKSLLAGDRSCDREITAVAKVLAYRAFFYWLRGNAAHMPVFLSFSFFFFSSPLFSSVDWPNF